MHAQRRSIKFSWSYSNQSTKQFHKINQITNHIPSNPFTPLFFYQSINKNPSLSRNWILIIAEQVTAIQINQSICKILTSYHTSPCTLLDQRVPASCHLRHLVASGGVQRTWLSRSMQQTKSKGMTTQLRLPNSLRNAQQQELRFYNAMFAFL